MAKDTRADAPDGRALVRVAQASLTLLAARTRVRTWVVTRGGVVVASCGPRAPATGLPWRPAGDGFRMALTDVDGDLVGELSAIGGTVVDVELAGLVALSLSALLAHPPTPSAAASADLALADLLRFARVELDLEVAFVGRFEQGALGPTQVVSALSGTAASGAGSWVRPGSETALADTLYQRVMDGRLPPVVPDTAVLAPSVVVPSAAEFPIASYAVVPLRTPDGTLYGTMCCLSRAPSPGLGERALEVMTAVSRAVMQLVGGRDGVRQDVLDIGAVLAAGGPRMVYQPAVALQATRRGFVEALSRFPDARPPDVWFAEAEQAGLGVELQLMAARNGLTAASEERAVAINLSAATISSGGLHDLLDGVPLPQVIVEVSEHEAVHDYQVLSAVLRPYREAGLRLAVDDAGAGYASLRHVVQLSPDVIKLDMSLVSGIDTDPSRRELAGALTSFAHRTGAVVVAEGVERLEEHSTLREVGVDLGQGYLYAVPGPLA